MPIFPLFARKRESTSLAYAGLIGFPPLFRSELRLLTVFRAISAVGRILDVAVEFFNVKMRDVRTPRRRNSEHQFLGFKNVGEQIMIPLS